MSKEYIILILSSILSITLLFILVPKTKLKIAHLSFLFMQFITWFLGLIVAEFRWVTYPVRFFSHANQANFTFEFIVYPTISTLFNVYYPENHSFLKKSFYFFSYTSIITISENILEKYTDLINYAHWGWYWTWLSLFITLLFSRLYTRWFIRNF